MHFVVFVLEFDSFEMLKEKCGATERPFAQTLIGREVNSYDELAVTGETRRECSCVCERWLCL